MRPGLHVVTTDVDQAFEACASVPILPGCDLLEQAYLSKFGTSRLLIRRGKKFLAEHGDRARSYGRGWWSFPWGNYVGLLRLLPD